ncbi:MAG: hypothetical protein EOO05_00460 [Chitinophagaceae bacterium]|nr:MAG: hypothetical protein EOO05_00460 [Chitinophagaceae bacterium]
MRLYFLLFICLFAMPSVYGQKNFEGTIIYSIRENNKPVGKMTVEFGPSSIHASFREESLPEQKEIYILFDSLMSAEVDHNLKEYRPRYYNNPLFRVEAPAEIGGYRIRAVPMIKTSSIASYFPNATNFISDELAYQIPEVMAGIDELLMLKNGKVVLGFILPDKSQDSVINFESAFTDPEFHGVLAKAISIVPAKLNASIFQIPAGYTRRTQPLEFDDQPVGVTDDAMIDSTQAIDESMITIIDTAAAVQLLDPPLPPPRKKQPAKKPAPKKTKTPAAARKPG